MTTIQCQLCFEPHSLNFNDITKEDFPLTVRCPSCSGAFEIRIDSNLPTMKVADRVEEFIVVKKASQYDIVRVVNEIKNGFKEVYAKFNLLRKVIDIEADAFSHECEKRFIEHGINVNGIDHKQLNQFYKQPFFGMPLFGCSFNKLVVCPKFIKTKLGFTLFETHSHYFYIVNKITLDTFNLPSSMIEYLEIKCSPDIYKVDNKLMGKDVILFYEDWNFIDLDFDHQPDLPSVVISNMADAMVELKRLGINLFSCSASDLNRDDVSNVLSGLEEDDVVYRWMMDIFNRNRVVLFYPNRATFNHFIKKVENYFGKELMVITDAFFGPIHNKIVNYFTSKDQLLPLSENINNFKILLIDLKHWASKDYDGIEDIARHYKGAIGIYVDDLLDGFMMKTDHETDRFLIPHALCPYTSIPMSIKYKLKMEDVSMLLTPSIEILKDCIVR